LSRRSWLFVAGADEQAPRAAARSGGFSVVEMMVVLGVVATLALMTLPSYIEKSVRDQVNEALPIADIAKPPIALTWAATKAMPTDNAAAGLPLADKIVNNYVRSVAVQDGAIHITFGNSASKSIAGKILTVRPAVVEDSPVVPVAWICGNGAVPDKMTVKGVNQTNLPPLFLPLRCRP
jgi:type IV pilus assembly protein PilA